MTIFFFFAGALSSNRALERRTSKRCEQKLRALVHKQHRPYSRRYLNATTKKLDINNLTDYNIEATKRACNDTRVPALHCDRLLCETENNIRSKNENHKEKVKSLNDKSTCCITWDGEELNFLSTTDSEIKTKKDLSLLRAKRMFRSLKFVSPTTTLIGKSSS